MFKELRAAILMLLVMTVLTGVAYPLVMTGIAQIAFHHKVNGSLIVERDKVLGSELIGQPFDDPKYFWSRPSATAPPYNAGSSLGSNLAVSNQTQIDNIAQRVKTLRESDPGNQTPIPQDLVTASGSGLDPHISAAAAQWQIPRVARVRRMDLAAVSKLVKDATQDRQFGILGEPVVNVLQLNRALDAAGPAPAASLSQS